MFGAFLAQNLEFTPHEEEFTAQACSWAVNSSLLPKIVAQGVLSPNVQVYKSYLSLRGNLEGFWGLKTPLNGVHGPRVFLGHKHIILSLFYDLNRNLHAI